MSFTYKIYTLKNPVTNKIFYIGITYEKIERRLKAHISKSKKGKHKVQLEIQKLLKNGIVPIIELLDILTQEEYTQKRTYFESYWVWQFKAWGFDLVNEKICK